MAIHKLTHVPGAGELIGNALGQGLMGGIQRGSQGHFEQQQKQQMQQQETSLLQKALQGAGPDPQSRLNAVLQSNASPETKKYYLEFEKANQGMMEAQQNQARLDQIYGGKDLQEQANISAALPPIPKKPMAPFKPGMEPNKVNPNNPGESPTPSGSMPKITNRKQLKDLTDDQLIELSGIKGHSESAKQELSNRQKINKENKADERAERKEQIDFHKESSKYDEDILESEKRANRQLETVDSIRKQIASGKVKPGSASAIFKGMGKVGDKISKFFLNPEQAIVEAEIPNLIEGWKDVFGVRLSDADLRVILAKLPDIEKSPESNQAVLKVIEKYAKMSKLRSDIARDIKEKNGGLRPLGYADKVEKTFGQAIQPVRVKNPQTGKIMKVPAYQVTKEMIDNGLVEQ